MKRKEMKKDCGDCHERQGHMRIVYAGQCTIPDMAGRTPDAVDQNTEMKSCNTDQVYWIPAYHNCSYPIYHWHHCMPSLFFIHNTTIITEYKLKSSLSISPYHCHETKLSIAYTKSSKHWVQHPPKIIDSHPYILTRLWVDPWMFIQPPAHLPTHRLQPACSPQELKGIVTGSHSNSLELIHGLIQF